MREGGWYWVKFEGRPLECAEWFIDSWYGQDFCGIPDNMLEQID